MTGPLVKGYCPGALRPMMSGDGLVVRIRPFLSRLSVEQGRGIADLSRRYGNGIIDLSSRANVQLRGISEGTLQKAQEGLRDLGLLDASKEIEARRNVIVTPFREKDDETEALAAELTQALCAENAPQIPHKFGFAVDTGKAPVLQTAPADIRLERASDGALILGLQGLDRGLPVSPDQAVAKMIDLARWFLQHRSTQNRMAQLLAEVPPPEGFTIPRQKQTFDPQPAPQSQGQLVGFAFGQMTVDQLAALSGFGPLRITPWRMILVETPDTLPDLDGLITDGAEPLLKVTACTGAPACTQARGDTRKMARQLAPQLAAAQRLHISGCAKGCAHPQTAPLTLTATGDGYDLICDGRAGDLPLKRGLSLPEILKAL